MIIVVDAYNLIKSILKVTYIQEKQRNQFIKLFQQYVLLRENQAILVFDGGFDLYEDDYDYDHLTIMYSGQMHTADDVIKRILKERQGRDVLLVTSDRDICDYASQCNIESIGSVDFYEILQEVMMQQKQKKEKVSQGAHKTTDRSNDYIDDLMEEGSRVLEKKIQDQEVDFIVRIRDHKKISKKDRRLLKKIAKI